MNKDASKTEPDPEPSELSADDLDNVAGGAAKAIQPCPKCGNLRCTCGQAA